MRLDRVASVCFGFLLIFSSPHGAGFFKDWLIPFVGSYRLNFFEAFVIPIIYIGLVYYGIRIKRHERFLFLSLILIIFSRITSLLAAEEMMMEQWVSIFRYIETLGLIYVFGHLLTDFFNRRLFILGLIVGASVETVGGIYIFLSTGGLARGIFVSVNSFILQIFLILACILVFINKRHRFWMFIFIFIFSLGIFVTGTRGALVLLIVLLTLAVLYARRRIIIPLVTIIVFSAIALRVVEIILPNTTEIIFTNITRISSAFAREGSVQVRTALWEMSIDAFLQHPVMGIGSGGFARQQEYLQTFTTDLPQDFDYNLSTHNTVLGVAAETGLIGLIVYLLWATSVIGICIKVLRLSNTDSSDNIYAISTSLLIIGIILSDLWGQGSFESMSNAFIGFVIGWYREKQR